MLPHVPGSDPEPPVCFAIGPQILTVLRANLAGEARCSCPEAVSLSLLCICYFAQVRSSEQNRPHSVEVTRGKRLGSVAAEGRGPKSKGSPAAEDLSCY